MPIDDTTTIRIFDKLDTISVDVGVIKAAMPNLATKDHVDLKIAEHAAIRPSIGARANSKKIGALVGAIVALARAIVFLVKMVWYNIPT